MRQHIAYSLFWMGCKNQNTQTISEILVLGDTLGQQIGMCKQKMWTLIHSLKTLFSIWKIPTFFARNKNRKIFVYSIIFLFENLGFLYKSVWNRYWYKKIVIWFHMKAHFFTLWLTLIIYFLMKRLCVFFHLSRILGVYKCRNSRNESNFGAVNYFSKHMFHHKQEVILLKSAIVPSRQHLKCAAIIHVFICELT